MTIQFNINSQKAIEAILWVIQKGESNLYNIMKILYSADKHHLNSYGRPVTGDKYIAMEYGTVPSWIYGAIQLKRQELGFARNGNNLSADRSPDVNYFSESDIEALEIGFKEYAGKNFGEVKKKNHAEPAWKKAYENRGDNEAAEIPFEDIIENQEVREYLDDLGGMTVNMVL